MIVFDVFGIIISAASIIVILYLVYLVIKTRILN